MLYSLLLWAAGWQVNAPAPCQARLELLQRDGLLTVTGHCRNLLPTACRYRYELAVRRAGKGGHSQNTQRGEFSADSAQEVALSKISVNVSAQDAYNIHLRVFDFAGHVVAQDSALQNSTR